MNMFFSENQWNETWSMGSAADASSGKSEHAISQPITMVQRRSEQYNANQPQSVTSPRSGDGSALGVHMVEYVLASSPGGHDLENRMKDMKLDNNLVCYFWEFRFSGEVWEVRITYRQKNVGTKKATLILVGS